MSQLAAHRHAEIPGSSAPCRPDIDTGSTVASPGNSRRPCTPDFCATLSIAPGKMLCSEAYDSSVARVKGGYLQMGGRSQDCPDQQSVMRAFALQPDNGHDY
jgi:hypothetical protein